MDYECIMCHGHVESVSRFQRCVDGMLHTAAHVWGNSSNSPIWLENSFKHSFAMMSNYREAHSIWKVPLVGGGGGPIEVK